MVNIVLSQLAATANPIAKPIDSGLTNSPGKKYATGPTPTLYPTPYRKKPAKKAKEHQLPDS